VTAAATVRLLTFMDQHPAAAVYRDALPVAGVDGTLRERMRGTAAEKNVRAKTGALRWASTLSGSVTTAAGERVAFSILLNRYQGSEDHAAFREVDAVAVLLAGLRQHSRESAP
jgi:D-alanyl-D-alanine carboxypeptidase/D-alanyl-D-alanine-endopeptidase (penicillin-binding protein 4)